ncbi:MAG: hypothetical protein HFJ65_00905 [Eggerthellaceae bacterium]|nr:hypothetical protein [Eggerthellaceae bacterium]
MGKHKDVEKKKPKKGKKKDKLKKGSKNKPKEFLESTHCTGCKKRCPLSDPRCKKGRVQAEALLKELKKKA